MSKTLNKIAKSYVKSNLKLQNVEDGVSVNDVVAVVQQNLVATVYKEIRAEIQDEAIREASEIIKKQRIRNRIKDYRMLLFTGIIMAFMVGMSVNQYTEIVSNLLMHNSTYSFLAGTMFLAICYAIYKELIDLEISKLLKIEEIE